MSWGEVGDWIKNNAGKGAALVGSLLMGNVQGAIAAGVSLVSGATGTDDPAQALASLQSDPAALIKLKELYYQNEADVRRHRWPGSRGLRRSRTVSAAGSSRHSAGMTCLTGTWRLRSRRRPGHTSDYVPATSSRGPWER